MHIKIKKRILAREVLIFFGCGIVFAFIFGILVLKNNYYERLIAQARYEIIPLSDEVANLPTDYDWELYNQVKGEFVLNSKKSISPPTVLNNDSLVSTHLISNEIDWSSIPDEVDENSLPYVSFIEFQDDLKSDEYQKKISRIINSNINSEEIKKGFGYDAKVYEKKKALNIKIETLTNKMSGYFNSECTGGLLKNYLMTISIVILTVVYVFRFAIMSIIWAIKTVKQDEPQNQNSL